MKARRVLAGSVATVLALALMIPTVLAAGVPSATDSFDTPSYSGGSGWTGNWAETGESTNPSQGVIQVVESGCNDGSNCVRFSAILSVAVGLQRTANFEGAENISLTFRYRKAGVGDLEVRARTGSGAWQTLETLANSGTSTSATVDLTGYASPTLQVMFHSTLGLLSSAHIDNVSISASYPTTTTTSSTTTTIAATTTTPTISTTITIPTVTTPPIVTTTTLPTVATTAPPGSTTSTTAAPTTTTTDGPASPPGQPDSDPPGADTPSTDPVIVLPPISEAEANVAAANNIAVDLANDEDFMTFGVNPLTNLGVRLNSTVEVITTEILSALALGAMLAFFGVRRVEDDDEPIPVSPGDQM